MYCSRDGCATDAPSVCVRMHVRLYSWMVLRWFICESGCAIALSCIYLWLLPSGSLTVDFRRTPKIDCFLVYEYVRR